MPNTAFTKGSLLEGAGTRSVTEGVVRCYSQTKFISLSKDFSNNVQARPASAPYYSPRRSRGPSPLNEGGCIMSNARQLDETYEAASYYCIFGRRGEGIRKLLAVRTVGHGYVYRSINLSEIHCDYPAKQVRSSVVSVALTP